MALDVKEFIQPLVSPREFRETFELKEKVKFTELDKVLRRDDAKILLPEIIDEQIQTTVEEKLIGRGLVDVVNIQSDSISWMEETGFNAYIVPEGAEIPIEHATWEKFFVSVLKIGVRPVITQEMIDDAHWPVMRRNIDQAVMAVAKKEDEMIMDALNAGVPNDSPISGGVGGVGKVVHNHRISIGPEASNNPLTTRALAKAFTILRKENYTPNTILCNPTQMYEMMVMEEFIGLNSQAYMTLPDFVRNSMVNGTVGKFYGANVVVSENQPAGQILVFDSSVYAVLMQRKPATTDEYTDVIRQLKGVIITERVMPAVVRRDAAVMLTNGRTNLTF
jgi:HK97 family phage major capsid protein